MESKSRLKILFVINPGSGSHSIDWEKEIQDYFRNVEDVAELLILTKESSAKQIQEKIASYNPDKIVAVGGDGTVTMVAECLLQKNIPLGILPAGSANGLAKELGISEIPHEALHTVITGTVKKVHVIKINANLCIHLSDLGFNARMIEKFQSENIRGIWGYMKATLKVARSFLLIDPIMKVSMTTDDKTINRKAAMIVIANATKYGSGAVINPTGDLEDELFEVVVIKKISVIEIFKMMVTHSSFDPQKTEVFKTRSLKITVSKKMHFQVDGEYLGKVNEIEANLIPAALEIIVPTKIS